MEEGTVAAGARGGDRSACGRGGGRRATSGCGSWSCGAVGIAGDGAEAEAGREGGREAAPAVAASRARRFGRGGAYFAVGIGR